MSISTLPQNPLLSHYATHNPSYSHSQPFASSSSSSSSATLPAPPQIPAPAPQLSASITRILTLSNFPATLKTRDLQNAFSIWEGERGGFKIKWIDDVTALVVFADPGTAKRAYLSSLLAPPPSLQYPATIRPYDGPDAQGIIQAVNARGHGAPGGHRGSMAGIGANPFGAAMGGNGKAFGSSTTNGHGYGGQSQGQGQANVTNGFQIPPSVVPFGTGEGNVRIGGGSHHVRASSVSSASGQERTSILATRMGGSIAAPGAIINSTSGHGQHHRAMSNSSGVSGGGSSWGRSSISGVLSGFSGPAGGGVGGASNGFNNPTTFGSYGTSGGNSTGAHSLPPLPPVNTNFSIGSGGNGGGMRLSTHMEVDTPAATPMKATAPGGYFGLSGSAVDTSSNGGRSANGNGNGIHRTNSAASDRSTQSARAQGQGQGQGHAQQASVDDLVSPSLEIRGGNQLEGMTGAIPSPTGARTGDQSSSTTTNNTGSNASNATTSGITRRAVRTGAMPISRGSAAFGSGNGVFGGSSFGGANGNNATASGGGAGGHARRESLDAGSAEKALDEVKKALQGLGVAS